jgi:hypothetical protein
MAIAQFATWRKGMVLTLPAADGAITDAILGVRIDDPAIVEVLNAHGEGQSAAFTLDDSSTQIPHHTMRADWPATISGAWTWYSRQEAVYENGYTYWFPVNEFGEVLACWYKHADGTTGSVVLETLSTGVGAGIDDHNNGAAIVLASGKLLVFYSDHGGAILKCRKQTTAGDPTTWDAAVSLGGSASTSYSNPVQLSGVTGTDGGAIYLFYRDESANYERRYKVSTDAGATWSAAVSIFRSPDNANRESSIQRPYMHVIGDSTGTKIHFLLSDGNPPEVTDPITGAFVNSIWHGYADVSANTVHQSDGTVLAGGSFTAPPAGGFDTADLTLVLDGYTAQRPFWNWALALDSSDRPVIFAVKYTGLVGTPYTSGDYTVSRWTGSAWSTAVIDTSALFGAEGSPIADTATQPYYFGGIAPDHADPLGTCYVSNADPEGGSSSWSIWKLTSTDSGATWAIAQKMNTSRGGERRCIRPVVPINATSELQVLWMEGHYLDFQQAWTGSGTSYVSKRFATGIQTYPRVNDGYVFFLKLNRTAATQEVHFYWDDPAADEQADAATVFSGWLDYPRDIHVNKWNTGRTVDMANDTLFTVLWIGYWDRAAYNSVQHTCYSNWVSGTTASIMLREQSAAGGNQACLWNTTSGTFGSVAWSSNPAVQTWNVLAARWQNSVSSGQMRPHLNGTALTNISGSAAAMPATASTNPLWVGWTPHTNGDLSFHGQIGFAAIIPEDKSADWIEEFSESNPFNPSWSYGSFSAETDFATIETITTAGSGTWTAPPNVNSVHIEATGAGGGGGSRSNFGGNGGAGAGGGGEFAAGDLFVTPGNDYAYLVPSGGGRFTGEGTGAAGSDCWFHGDDATEVRAKGGRGGRGGVGGVGGAGGTGGTGDYTYDGGAGGTGSSAATGGGGGGGEGASLDQVGNDGAAGSAGAGGAGGTGGAGGDGGAGGNNSAGSTGSAPGGGGGGASQYATLNNLGGVGGSGRLVIAYVESSAQEITLRTAGGEDMCTDGGTFHLGDFPDNNGTTIRTYYFHNTHPTDTVTLNYPPVFVGDGEEEPPGSIGTAVLDPGERSAIGIQLNTATAGDGYSFTMSITHDGAQSPFNCTLTFDVTASLASLVLQDSDGLNLGSTGGTYHVGSAYLGTSLVRTFRLYNDGGSDLTIDFDTQSAAGGNMIVISPDGGQVVVTPGNYTEIVCRFITTTLGTNLASEYNVEHDGPSGYFEFFFTHTVQAAPEVAADGGIYNDFITFISKLDQE